MAGKARGGCSNCFHVTTARREASRYLTGFLADDEGSRARDRTEPATDDVKELRAQLEAATGERIAARSKGSMRCRARRGTRPWRPRRRARARNPNRAAGARARKGGGYGPRAVTEWRAVDVGRYRYRALESARWTVRHEAVGQEAGPVPSNEKRHYGCGRKAGARGERAWRRTEFRKASRY